MIHRLLHLPPTLRTAARLLRCLCLVCLVALASCQRSEVYMEYLPVDTQAWINNDKLEFDLTPVPEDGLYVLSVELRTTEANIYPYKELLIEVRQLWSQEEDAVTDSLYSVNDSLCAAYRVQMAENERLITVNNERVGINRRAQLQAEQERAADEQSDDADKPKPKGKKKKAGKGATKKDDDRDDDNDVPYMTRRDSIIATTDSLIKSIDVMRAQIWRLEGVNDSIDLERKRRVTADTVAFRFDIPDRTATGIVVRQYSIPVRVLSLIEGQTAHIVLRHIMRLEALPGISDIGLTLEKQ